MKSHTTDGTDVWFHIQVAQLMVLESPGSTESLSALAYIWSLTSMESLMHPEIGQMVEFFSANRAYVRQITRVKSHVVFKTVRSSKSITTYCTAVRLSTSVQLLMYS